MNIFKKELTSGIKPFLFWSSGLFVLLFAGSIKFTGIDAGGENITALVNSMPRIVRAIMGVVGINIATFGGYYSVLSNFALIITASYAVYLGSNAVTREAFDKTYEFVFTKPCTRSYILGMKLINSLFYLVAFCMLNFVVSMLSVWVLQIQPVPVIELMLFSGSTLISSLLFFSVSVMLCSASSQTELGTKISHYLVMATFAIGIVYDMLENATALRFFTPFKFFLPSVILERHIAILFVVYSVLISAAALIIGFRCFEKKDLIAS